MNQKLYYLFLAIPLLSLFLLALPAVFSAGRDFQREKTNRKIEQALPNLLLSISSLPYATPFQQLIEKAASAPSEASIPFKLTLELMRRGSPIQLAVSTSFASYPPAVQKTGELLTKLYKNGNSTLSIICEYSVELSRHNELKEGAKADATMQKYSLLAASAFLVPFIIAVISAVSQRASPLLFISVQTLSPAAVFIAINLYLVIFAFLSAKFLSRQFSTHFVTFFSITCPLSLLVFNLTSVLLA